MKYRSYIFCILVINCLSSTIFTKPTGQEIQKVLRLLSKKFNFQETPSVKIRNSLDAFHLMYYSKKSVNVYKNTIKSLSATEIYALLLHEFRHYMQEQNQLFKKATGLKRIENFYDQKIFDRAKKHKAVLWFPDDSLFFDPASYPFQKNGKKNIKIYALGQLFKPYEFDAESFCIENITCPVCYDILLATTSRKNISPEGYVGLAYMIKFRKDKQGGVHCRAHTFGQNEKRDKQIKKIYSCLYKKPKCLDSLKEKIRQSDNACGSLSDRHIK